MFHLPTPFLLCRPRFDVQRVLAEVEQVVDEHWWRIDRFGVDTGHLNYKTVGLVTHGGTENDFQDPPFAATPMLARLPRTRQLLAWFESPLAEVRLRSLGSGARVPEHFDGHAHLYSRLRFHLPLISEPDAYFTCDGVTVNMRPGELWLFDRLRTHAADNLSSNSRLHLIVDVLPSTRLLDKMAEGFAIESPDDLAAARQIPARLMEVSPSSTAVGDLEFCRRYDTESELESFRCFYADRFRGDSEATDAATSLLSHWENTRTDSERRDLLQELRRADVIYTNLPFPQQDDPKAWLTAVCVTALELQLPPENSTPRALRDFLYGQIDITGELQLQLAGVGDDAATPIPRLQLQHLCADLRAGTGLDLRAYPEAAARLDQAGLLQSRRPDTRTLAPPDAASPAGDDALTIPRNIFERVRSRVSVFDPATGVLPTERPLRFVLSPTGRIAVFSPRVDGYKPIENELFWLLAALRSGVCPSALIGRHHDTVDLREHLCLLEALGLLRLSPPTRPPVTTAHLIEHPHRRTMRIAAMAGVTRAVVPWPTRGADLSRLYQSARVNDVELWLSVHGGQPPTEIHALARELEAARATAPDCDLGIGLLIEDADDARTLDRFAAAGLAGAVVVSPDSVSEIARHPACRALVLRATPPATNADVLRWAELFAASSADRTPWGAYDADPSIRPQLIARGARFFIGPRDARPQVQEFDQRARRLNERDRAELRQFRAAAAPAFADARP